MPNKGDICWISFEPHKGNEEGGHSNSDPQRPMLILTGHIYSMATGDVAGMPITSHMNKMFKDQELVLKTIHHKVHGYIMYSKLNSFDFLARDGQKAIDHISKESMSIVDYYFRSMFDLLN